MSGAHIPIARKLVKLVKEAGIEDKLIAVGGVIPKRDIPVLEEMGVKGIFPNGTDFDIIINFIKNEIGN